MNIKNIAPQAVLPIDSKKRVDANQRTQAGTDRDADGRRDTEPETKRHLSQQEFDEALKVLAEMPGLKSNNLSIKVEVKADCRIVLIIDGKGQIVRRLSESQLWLATRDKDRQTGNILDKAM